MITRLFQYFTIKRTAPPTELDSIRRQIEVCSQLERIGIPENKAIRIAQRLEHIKQPNKPTKWNF